MQETLDYIKQAFELKSQGCYKQAVEMLYKALELENDNTEILFQLGELYFLLKNFERAKHYMEKVLKLNEKHTDALKILIKIYEYSNDYSHAFLTAKKLYEIQSDKSNLLKLISILSKKGDTEIIKEYLNLEDDEIMYAVSKAFYDNKLFKESEGILNKALIINPENTDVRVLLGKIYFDKSEFEKSKEIFTSLSKFDNNAEVLNYLGLFALEDMKFIDAIKYFSKASNSDKKNSRFLYNLANAYFYNGWIKEAVASYMQAVCLEPDNNDYRYSLAYLYYEINNYDKAQKEVDFILETDEQYSQAHVLNALLKLNKKDYLGAKLELETNLKNGFDDNFTLISLADVYKELQMYDKAEDAVKKVIERNKNSLNYKCKLADILTAEKKADDALNIINSVLKSDENYISAYIIGAKAALIKNDLETAKEYAQQAISLDMNYWGGYYYLALVRFEEKDFEEAIECNKRAITYNIENPELYAFMSKIYEAQNDYFAALEYIKEAENISGSTEYRVAYKRLSDLKKKNR